MTAEPILAIHGVTRTWPGRPVPVLDDVTLDLQPGEIAWVGGKNGAGKTTLLRIICGLLAPDRGDVRITGHALKDGQHRYNSLLGFLSAGDRGLIARLSVAEHLGYWARIAYIPRADRAAAIADVVEKLQIEPLLDRRIDRLSLGQRQRVRIAMAYMHGPQLLVLDEPRNSLDDDGYAALNRVVTSVADRGGAAIWCSPRGEDRVVAFDRGFVLSDGRLEAAA